jgi:hypothetical protein
VIYYSWLFVHIPYYFEVYMKYRCHHSSSVSDSQGIIVHFVIYKTFIGCIALLHFRKEDRCNAKTQHVLCFLILPDSAFFSGFFFSHREFIKKPKILRSRTLSYVRVVAFSWRISENTAWRSSTTMVSRLMAFKHICR